MRLLYLTRGASTLSGRAAFAGRDLYDRLAETSHEAVAAHAVAAPAAEGDIPLALLDRDVMTPRSYLHFDPHAIYLEGGLLDRKGDWRVPRVLLEQSVRSGAVLVVADAGYNELLGERSQQAYLAAAALLGSSPRYGSDVAYAQYPLHPTSPVYALDKETNERTLRITPERMYISDWLWPVYEGVDYLVADSPVALDGAEDVLAVGDQARTATLCDDVWVDEVAWCPFATVRQFGDGYVAFIAAHVSSDASALQKSAGWRGNWPWLVQLVHHLRRETARDATRFQGLRRLQHSFRELKATEHIDETPGLLSRFGHVLDHEVQVALRRDAAKSARSQLQTILPTHWSRIVEASQRQLIQAELYRRDAELLEDTDEAQDFSASVGAYSRALEIQLLRELFEPFRDWHDAEELPEPKDAKREGRSLDALRRFLDGRNPSLGDMAFILMHVGCRLRHVTPNAFAVYLQRRISDFDLFCREFPTALLDYTEVYRNPAMHIGELTAAECRAARGYLLDEPVHLLISLCEWLGSGP